MKLFLLRSSWALCLLCFGTAAFGNFQITVNGTAGGDPPHLLDNSGQQLADSRLGLVVVDTDGLGFGSLQLTPGAYELSSFYSSTGFFFLGAKESEDFGITVVDFTINYSGPPSLPAGSPYAVLWFPDIEWTNSNVTTGSFTLLEGQSYGLTTSPQWETPSTGGTTVGGSAPGGTADFQVVPEPSTVAFLFGVAGLAFAIIRRRR